MSEKTNTPLTGIQLENFNLLTNPTNVIGFTPPTTIGNAPPSLESIKSQHEPDAPNWMETYAAENQEGDVEIDFNLKLPTSINARLGARRTVEDKAAFLIKEYGNARYDNAGGVIVRILDENGTPKDVKVGGTAWDVGVQGGTAIAGTALALYSRGKVKTLPKVPKTGKKAFKEMLKANVGGAGAGVFLDSAVRTIDSKRLDPHTRQVINSGWVERMQLGEMAQARGSEVVLGLIADSGIYAAGRSLGMGVDFATDPLGGAGSARTEMQDNVLAAIGRIEGHTGVKMPVTSSMLSGNPVLARAESFAEETRVMRLGDKGVPTANRIAMQSDLAQKAMLDQITPSKVDIAQVSKEASEAIDNIGRHLEQANSVQRVKALQASRNRVISELENASGTSAFAAQDPSVLGNIIRQRVKEQRDLFKRTNDTNYSMVTQINGGESIEISTDLIEDALKEIKTTVPKKEIVENLDEVKLISDKHGNMLRSLDQPASKKKKVPLREFIPADTMELINSATAFGKDKSMPLNELVRIRRDIYDKIGKASALPNVSAHDLNKIGEALTETINDTTRVAKGNPDAIRALQHANEHYTLNFEKFKDGNINRMFAKKGEPGHLYDNEIAERILNGQNIGVYNAYKEVIGDEGMVNIRKTLAKKIIHKARSSVNADVVNISQLADSLHDIGLNNPELLRELFGPNAVRIAKEPKEFAAFLERQQDTLQRMTATHGRQVGNVPESIATADLDEFTRFLKSDDRDVKAAAKKIFEGEQKIRRLNQNRIFRAISTSNAEEISAISPDAFIDFITSKKVTEADSTGLRNIMDALKVEDPQLYARVRRGVLTQFLHQHQAAGDMIGAVKGSQQLIDPAKIAMTLKDESYVNRLKSVVGEAPMQNIFDLAIYEAGRKGNTHAGSLVTANHIAEMMQGNVIRSFPRRVKYSIIGSLLESDKLRPYLTGEGLPLVGNTRGVKSDIATAIPLTTEVLSGLSEMLTTEEFEEFVLNWKDKVGKPIPTE
tara:strand:+ start:881 stop:3895 length:3015 start_codon:yes stop_codon:yes gene_type:complete